ncbi:zf-HC2 domain-containing protein [bacterium]|nr:zf-HC2 domain-containing protein [bacterium]
MKDKIFEDLMYHAFAREEKKRGDTGHDKDSSNSCLSDETVSLYLESRLPDAENERVQEHLLKCSSCLRLVIDVVESEAMEKAEISRVREGMEPVVTEKKGLGNFLDAVIEPLRISLAWAGGHLTLIKTDAEYIPFWNGLIPALVRGGSDKKALSLPPFLKTYKDCRIRVRVMEEEEGRCAIQCEVFPLSEKKEGKRIRVELMRSGRLLRSSTFENNPLQFQGIPSGDYTIGIRDGGQIIGDVSIKIA